MYSAIAIPMEAVADHIPLKQGLRLEILFTSVKSSFVADHIPLEQGLRPHISYLASIKARCRRPYQRN